MKNFRQIHSLLNSPEYSKKISVFFATRSVGEDYDPYEENHEFAENILAPQTIRGLVTQVTPTQLVYKQYGLDKQGAVEIVTESKYKTWFENATKIKIDSIEYEVFKDATGGRVLITDRANNTIKIVLTRK